MRGSTSSMVLRRASLATLPGVLALIAILGACGGDDSVTGPQLAACGPRPYLTVLPVPAANLSSVPVVGGVDAPGHTLPTDHGAFFLNAADVVVRSPADMTITNLRVVRSEGPNEPFSEDYAIYFQVCREVGGWFGHVTSLAPRFSPETIPWANCRSYSTGFAEFETCDANVAIEVMSGDDIATGSFVVDFGMVDTRVTNFYISPERWGTSHAVCMWEQFDAANQAILFSKLLDLRRPEITPTGEPRCGTMEVDVPGTAKGSWAHPGLSGPAQADERDYMALVDYPYRPQMELALSLGPDSLGARLAVVERRTGGRVNRAFEEVTPDGQIHCYGPTVDGFAPSSWFLEVTSATAVRMERLEHPAGASPCDDDPSTWSFGAGAVTMVR